MAQVESDLAQSKELRERQAREFARQQEEQNLRHQQQVGVWKELLVLSQKVYSALGMDVMSSRLYLLTSISIAYFYLQTTFFSQCVHFNLAHHKIRSDKMTNLQIG